MEQVKQFGRYQGDKEETGFVENFVQAAALTYREDMSISSMITSRERNERSVQLYNLYKEGVISEQIYDSYFDHKTGQMDEGGLADYAINSLGRTEVLSEEDLKKAEREELTAMREEAQDVFDRSTFLGKAGRFLGPVLPLAVDPVTLPTYLVGFGAVAKAAHIAKIAGRFALAEGTAEAVRQIPVTSWKEEIGVDYSLSGHGVFCFLF